MTTFPRNIILRLILPILAITLLCFTSGCNSGNEKANVITVFAAASLTDSFQDIASEFESQKPGVKVKLSFAGSQRLRSQLEFGAEADVFASANELQMELAKDAGLVAGNSRRFASASMSVIASKESSIDSLADLANPGAKLVMAHESVPAGQYSRMLLQRLSTDDSGLGEDFADRVLGNVVSEETSVKFVEQKVVLGQADAGILYRPGLLTATADGAARELPLPAAAEVRAYFPIAALSNSTKPELAALFVDFVLSKAAQGIMTTYGFEPP